MQFHRQLNPHIPSAGIIGDCHRTCIACLMNLRPEEVPNFAEIDFDPSTVYQSDGQRRIMNDWLADRGLTLFTQPIMGQPLENVLNALSAINGTDFVYILTGQGTAGHGHVCLYKGSKLLWCPSGSAGLIGPHPGDADSPPMYWIVILASLRHRHSGE